MFREQITTCFIENNINHVQSNAILLLRTHNCFANLSKDVRTLLKTRTCVKLRKITQENIFTQASLLEKPTVFGTFLDLNLDRLEIDFSIDGAILDNSGEIQI